MRKQLFSGLFLAVFALVSSFTLSQAAEYNWKLAHEEVEDGFMDLAAKEFAKLLAEKSGNRIELAIYPNGDLGSSEDMVEMVRSDAIQFNFAAVGGLGSVVAESQALLLHFLFPKDMNLVNRVLEKGSFRAMMDQAFRSKGFEPLAYLSEGWDVWTSNKSLRTPEDFKGFTMRTMASRIVIDNFKAYGATPVPLPFREVYASLADKALDGQENPVFIINDNKFYEHQQILTFAYASPMTLLLLSSQDFFVGLPEDIRSIVEESVKELLPYAYACEAKLNQDSLVEITTKRPQIRVVELSEEERVIFNDKSWPVRDKFFRMAPERGPAILQALENDIKSAR